MIEVPVSIGELYDKISILEIKVENSTSNSSTEDFVLDQIKN